MDYIIDERYVGSTCEIRSFANELLSIGIIDKIDDEFISVSPHGDRLRLFNTSAKIKLNIFNSKAGFAVLLGEVLTSSSFQLKIVEPLKIIDHERRSGFRVEVDLWAKISMSNNFTEDSDNIQVIYVNDVSICGLRAFSDKIYNINQIFWLELTIENTKIITEVQVMRKSEKVAMKKNNVDYYEYGIKMINLRPEDDDKLCSYLFKRQREISKKVK